MVMSCRVAAVQVLALAQLLLAVGLLVPPPSVLAESLPIVVLLARLVPPPSVLPESPPLAALLARLVVPGFEDRWAAHTCA